MTLGRGSKAALWALMAVVGAFVYVPLILVAINAFNSDPTFGWPPSGFTLEWWDRTWSSAAPREALVTSLKAGAAATAIALVLGSLLAFALTRMRFFGRGTVSLLVVLPIALPGIVTGVALQSTIQNVLEPVFGIGAGLFTIIVGHATFCIVVVFNNVQARLRRLGTSLDQASADLGASRWQTLRYVTLPMLSGALVAGGLLAFALSFDEIVVTTFTAGPGSPTLPIFIFNNLFRPAQAPVVNVVALVLVLASLIPVTIAQRVSRDAGASRM